MSTRQKLAVAAAGTLLAIFVLVITPRSTPEPIYKGLTMAKAIRSGDEGHEALHALGTNNLQLLVKRVRYNPEKDLLSRCFHQLYRLSNFALMEDIALRRRRLAEDAQTVFYRLGPKAAAAVPQLARIAEDGGSSSLRAIAILGDLGEEGLAIVASRAAHGNAESRRFAVTVLSPHHDSWVARSALTNAYIDPDPNVRATALLLYPPGEFH